MRILDKRLVLALPKSINFYSVIAENKEDGFRVLNLKQTKSQASQRRKPKRGEVLPPRAEQMAIDQDWGNVWPGPKTFHPAVVPLPVRQGYVEKEATPDKYANTELMKIPNFLHLTPPVVKRQCEALKKFCTSWPKALDSDEKCQQHFPIEIISSNYCHSSPTIRDPLARIITLKIKLSTLKLDDHAKDKIRRLVGERYDEKSDILTLVTDRCPTRKQNYDYAMYLLTALYHESWEVEPWENLKSDADMEFYDWNNSISEKAVEKLFNQKSKSIDGIEEYISQITSLMNEGESEYTVTNYGTAVRKLLKLPTKTDCKLSK